MTKLLFRSIRPSILGRIGEGLRPADLLDEDGIAGWQIGTTRLLEAANRFGPDLPPAVDLKVWLLRDIEAERVRWRNPSTSIWQFCVALHHRLPAGSDDDFFLAWRSNFEAALRRSRHWGTHPTRSDAMALQRIHRRLQSQERGAVVLETLEELSDRAADCEPVPIEIRRFVTRRERALLEAWLESGGAGGSRGSGR